MVYLAASCGLPTCPCGARDSWWGSLTLRPPARALNTNHHGGTRTRTVSFAPSAEEKTRDEDRRPRQGAPSRPEHTGVSDQQPFLTHHSILWLFWRFSPLSLGVLASHWLGRACDARPSLIGQRKHSMPFFGAGLRSEAMEAPPTSVLGTHAREEGRWWQERRRDVIVIIKT